MQHSYILAIDQSTQSTKALLFDENTNIVSQSALTHKQIITKEGWVEHDLSEIKTNIKFIVKDVIEKANIDKSLVKAMGITNQRESVGIWNKNTGEPLCNSVVWQCNRAASICEALSKDDKNYLEQTTGIMVSPFSSASKIEWLLENTSNAKELAKENNLCCGTMDCWTLFVLTEGKSFKTDTSNAGRMQLLNLKTQDWDAKCLEIFNIPQSILPEIQESNSIFGYTTLDNYLDTPIPIHAMCGDSNVALFAQGCHQSGDCMTGYGTGSCVMLNIGNTPIISENRLNTSPAWKINNQTTFMFDGVINDSGATITWLVKSLKLANSPQETETLANNANPEDKTYLVPCFSGLGAPYWSTVSNAIFYGMTRNTKKEELVKACLESMAYLINDIAQCMAQDANLKIKTMKTSGGPTLNKYLMQFQSDILNADIYVPQNNEMSCQGVAFMAGLASNVYTYDIFKDNSNTQIYTPKMSNETRDQKLRGWEKAVSVVVQ